MLDELLLGGRIVNPAEELLYLDEVGQRHCVLLSFPEQCALPLHSNRKQPGVEVSPRGYG
jgi:hypothetical protein